MDQSPTGRGPVDQQDAPGDQRGRYRLHGVGAALVAAFAVCLPTLAMWNVVAEWSGVVLLLRTFLTVIAVLIAAAILRAVGRTRPAAAALGKGAFFGAALGLLAFLVLGIAFPAPPPPDPTQPWPATVDRPLTHR